jgi:hypothetical protein
MGGNQRIVEPGLAFGRWQELSGGRVLSLLCQQERIRLRDRRARDRGTHGAAPILGCPLNNLAQEMNPLDAGFRARTTQVFQTWREAYRNALTRAQQRQIVTATVDPGDVAHMLVAQIEGTLSLARNTQDPQTLATGARALRTYNTGTTATGQGA